MRNMSMPVDPLIREELRPVCIPGIKNGMYLASNYGRIYSIHKGEFMYASISSEKFPTIGLVTETGGSKTFRLDFVIASVFCYNPNPAVLTRVVHKNCVYSDCQAWNLFWSDSKNFYTYNKYTESEYEFVHRNYVGWKPPKLTREQVANIRTLNNYNIPIAGIRDMLGLSEKDISDSAIRDVINNRTFVEVQAKYY